MKLIDIGLISLCCIIWGANAPMMRWLVGEVPPVFLSFLRFFGVTLILSRYLLNVPKQLGLVFLISLCIGGFNFIILFLAFRYSSASAVSIVGKIDLPIVTVLSILFLGEIVRWRRTLGMAFAFIGVLIVLYKPGEMRVEVGLMFAVASAFLGAVGTILMKRLIPIGVFQLQAWVAFLSIGPLLILTLFFEQNQIATLIDGGPYVWAGVIASVVLVALFGHSAFYYLVKKYDVTQVMPFTLTVPLWAVVFSTIFLGEEITPKLIIGGVLCLGGVWLVSIRENKSLPREAIAGKMEV